MSEQTKIGLAVITCNRLNYLKQCVESLNKNNWGGADVRMIVRDNDIPDEMHEYLTTLEDTSIIIAWHKNQGVGITKNKAFKTMLLEGCTDLFVMEDDIIMKNPNTCKHYITEAKRIGVQHMNFAHHGPMNKGAKSTFGLATVYPHCIGAFSYYTRKVLERVGLMDENFVNAYEHVHHTWRIANHNFTTPFWYFADHPQSHLMLEEIPGSISNSSIRIREDWQTNIGKAKEYWVKKHGFFLPPFPREFYTKSNGTIQS